MEKYKMLVILFFIGGSIWYNKRKQFIYDNHLGF